MRSLLFFALALSRLPAGEAELAPLEVTSLTELARAVTESGRHIKLRPGTYRFADYFTEEVVAAIRAGIVRTEGRPLVPLFPFSGNDNTIDLSGVEIEVDTDLYAQIPGNTYICTFVLTGSGNLLRGPSFRTFGSEQHGGNGTLLCLKGERNTVEDATLRLQGSFPYGYGDLLGKGGPNLISLRKQSGVRILGTGSLLRRCRVLNRAFGHCYYIQAGDDIRLEDCYAEGAMRATEDMLRETSGPAFELGFKSVYENRDGRYAIVPGYMKALTEDGFRTYGGAGRVTLLNCTAINTRAGFEIGAKDDAPTKTIVENCVARGCERAFLIGSQTVVRRSRGDMAHGPLLYLRGGRDSDVELELVGDGPQSLVHAVATLAGENHRVRLSLQPGERAIPALPILVGFGMPAHAEMSSPIRPAPAKNLTLRNEIAVASIITSDTVADCRIETTGRIFTDAELRASPGSWGLPANGIAPGGAGPK